MGVGAVDADRDNLSLVYSCVISTPRANSLPERLHQILAQLLDLMQDWNPAVVAIESPFVARNVRAALAVGQAQGVAMVAAAHHKIPVYSYSPREVKRAVADHGGSSKEQVQNMVGVLLGFPHELKLSSDEADALAVAICHIAAVRVDELTVREDAEGS